MVDDSIAATFSSFHVAIFDENFVYEIVGESGDLVAGSIAVFELVDEGFEGVVMLGGELGELGFEGVGDLDG